ncbi:hypothetical protein QBC46DRAFT_265721, partial [Diplogelasinospora grovesii]
REYSCGHFRWIASKWCKEYTITHRRCEPNVTHFECRAEEVCGECKPKLIALTSLLPSRLIPPPPLLPVMPLYSWLS